MTSAQFGDSGYPLTRLARTPVVTCRVETPVDQVARQSLEQDVGAVVVVDDGEQPIGMVTHRDLVSRVIARDRSFDTPVGEIMTRDLTTIRDDRTLAEAARQMASRECRRLPVIDRDGRLIGIISFDDIFAEIESTIESLSITVHQHRHPSVRAVA